MPNIWWEKLQAKKASKGSVIWTAETNWNQIVTENPNKNV